MTGPGVLEFIRAYASRNEARIRFDWNGEHGDDFEDRNEEFRQAVQEVVLREPDSAPLELLRALYRAETEWAREAWCVRADLHELGELLLRRGGRDVVLEFLGGRAQSFDTMLGLARVELDPAVAKDLADHCTGVLTTSTDDRERKLASLGIEQFGGSAAG